MNREGGVCLIISTILVLFFGIAFLIQGVPTFFGWIQEVVQRNQAEYMVNATATVIALTPTATPNYPKNPMKYHFTVHANMYLPGLDTGIDVINGEHIVVTAMGQATYGQKFFACAGYPTTDPDGNRQLNGQPCSPEIDNYAVLPSAPVGELLAGIKQSDSSTLTWFAVGSKYSSTISVSGRLFLLYNDDGDEGAYGDNAGDYQVTITITPP